MTDRFTPPVAAGLLPIQRLGARETSPDVIEFGILLPGITGYQLNPEYRVSVKVIHEQDQFIQHIPPQLFELTYQQNNGDYWSTTVRITPARDTHWGQPGKYVYRYVVEKIGGPTIDWVIDPFAREFGVGKLSAFTLGYQQHTWDASEATWTVPKVKDLSIYELMIQEFAGSVQGVIDRLDYLKDLGINCLEIMPVTNAVETINWGYMPLGYFGVDERFGNQKIFQALVEAAHARGMAVILDMVYAHSHSDFAYNYLYRSLGLQSPFVGPYPPQAPRDDYGIGSDFSRKFTRDFFATVNMYWLDQYHVDGFRYDFVPGYWDGNGTSDGYNDLVYRTYTAAQAIGQTDHWRRFYQGNDFRLIQCAEELDRSVAVLDNTYSTCTWQDGTYHAACHLAGNLREPIQDQAHVEHRARAIEQFAARLGLDGFPVQVTTNGITFEKTALQYLTNHDHSRFICEFGLENPQENTLLYEGKRGLWYKAQPFLIGLLLAKGIPLIWQGEEVCENYALPYTGMGRVLLYRPVDWNHFYDEAGQGTIGLTRKLLALRNTYPEFRSDHFYFVNHYENYQRNGVMVYTRGTGREFSIIVCNFSDTAQTVPICFPMAGAYQELLHGDAQSNLNIPQVTANTWMPLVIPSFYGRIWRLQS